MTIKYAKPRGTIISLQMAKSIAAYWHGGQWSPLYSFVSSYKRGDNFAWISAISEISASDKKEINALRKFFIYKYHESK